MLHFPRFDVMIDTFNGRKKEISCLYMSTFCYKCKYSRFSTSVERASVGVQKRDRRCVVVAV